jgi:membrane protease YdiL (CAAX protease family)
MPPVMDPRTLPVWNGLLSSWDAYLLTFVLAVVVPVSGYVRFRRLPIQGGLGLPSRTKVALYVKTICWQWFLVAALLVVLRRHRLSLSAIGEHLGDPRLTMGATGAFLVVLALVFAIVRWRLRRVRTTIDPSAAADRVRALGPAFGREMWVFAVVSLTAGICEELLYRGWLVNLLRVATGSVWIAVGLGAAVFGVAHAYQGTKGMLRTSFIGLQLALLFVYVDSLIPGQVLHAGVDLVAGFVSAIAGARRVTAAAGRSGRP